MNSLMPWRHFLAAVALGVLAGALLPAGAAEAKPTKATSLPPTAALTWNSIMLSTVRNAVITTDGPPRSVLQAEGRVYTAYVQAAVYDAVTKIEGRYVPYHDFGANPDGAALKLTLVGGGKSYEFNVNLN